MAKNKGFSTAPDYAQQQESIRKAKGNPNKNIHHKKKNSNYHGVDYQAQKASVRMEQQNKRRSTIFEMTPTNRIIFLVLLALMMALLIMSMTTAYKGNALVSYASSLASGATCCFLAYVGHGNKAKKKDATTFQTALVWVLGILGALYVLVGAMGLYNLFRA